MSSFIQSVKIASSMMRLQIPKQFSRLANGQIIPSALGEPYWMGSGAMITEEHADAAEYELALMNLDRPGQSFLVYDNRFNGPRLDPEGTLLEGFTPEIHSLGGNNRSLRVNGLPENYALSRGDYIGWQYGSSPTRYALHRVASAAIATGGGLTPMFDVEPHIRPGAEPGLLVELVRPCCKAIMTASDYGRGSLVFTDPASFSWQETLR